MDIWSEGVKKDEVLFEQRKEGMDGAREERRRKVEIK